MPNADAHPLRPDAKGLPDANPMSRPGTSLMSKRPSSSDPDGLTSPQTLTGRGPGHATMPGIRDCLTALLPGGEGRPGLSYRMFGIHTHTHTHAHTTHKIFSMNPIMTAAALPLYRSTCSTCSTCSTALPLCRTTLPLYHSTTALPLHRSTAPPLHRLRRGSAL